MPHHLFHQVIPFQLQHKVEVKTKKGGVEGDITHTKKESIEEVTKKKGEGVITKNCK